MSGKCTDLAIVRQKQLTMLVKYNDDVAMDWYGRLEMGCASWRLKEQLQQADRTVDMLPREEVVGSTYRLALQIDEPGKDKSNLICYSAMAHRAS